MDEISPRIKRTLAADVRYTQIDPGSDQVWQFNAVEGEPRAVAVETTFGLNCISMRIFPRFTRNGISLSDPATFFHPVQIRKRLTNYLQLLCTPFPFMDVEIEYWVPSSNSICGRSRISNSGPIPLTFNYDWAAVLQPQSRGELMTAVQMGINTVLRGSTGSLSPVFFLTGGPVPSAMAYPALSLEMTLTAGSERRVSWALAALESYEASFLIARQNTALQWDSGFIKHEMEEKRSTFLFSSEKPLMGDLLQETQVKARQCFLYGAPPARRLTLLPKRQPDSPIGNYAVSPRTKQGNLPATVYDFWQASRILLPAAPDTIQELIFGYINMQQSDGSIPWMISPGGNPSRALTPPLLAGIARDVYRIHPDPIWLNQVYAPLLQAFRAWFRRGEGGNAVWPTWENLLQTNLDLAPLYSVWQKQDQGLDARFIDSPALNAMLYHECLALLQLQQALGKNEEVEWLESKAEEIKNHTQTSWNEEKAIFEYRDAVTGKAPAKKALLQIHENGLHSRPHKLTSESRLVVACSKLENSSGFVEVTIRGQNASGMVTEEIHFSPSTFSDGSARATTNRLFAWIESVEVAGIRSKEAVKVYQAGFDDEDLSQALPLWAGLCSPEQAKALVKKTLLPRYLTRFGLSCLPADHYPERESSVNPFWNSILIEGLLNCGFREAAAKIQMVCLGGMVTQWQKNGTVNDLIRVTDAVGIGNKDTMAGFPAVLTLLELLGIEKINQEEIIFNGINDLLPSFNVQYGRVKMQMNREGTTISTLNGSKVEIHTADRQRVVLP